MLTHLLSLLIWLPMVFGLVLLLLNAIKLRTSAIKGLGLIFSLVILGLCVLLYGHFDATSFLLQFNESHDWIPILNIHYALGVDGLSVLFILLTCFTNLIIVLSAWKHVEKNVAEYIAIFLFSTGILNGIFAAQDAILYYFFWEASMIPLYLGVGIWGGERRAYAALKFFLYNMLGSLAMLIGFVYLYLISGSFSLSVWQGLSLSPCAVNLLFFAFFLSFAVKMPMWPLHTWFADFHAEAPAGGSIALAALMLKNGGYGFLRFNLPMVPAITSGFDWLLIGLALIAVVIVGFSALAQKDMKRLIAYSSVSHMGIVTLGIFMVMMILMGSNTMLLSAHTAAVLSVQGAIFQMISHAFASGGLFILLACLAARFGSSFIQDYQGLAKTMPVFAAFFVLFAMAGVGLPGTTGFVGEFFVILAALQSHFWVALIAGCTLIISPAYMLWLLKRVIFGEVPAQNINRVYKGLSCTEWIMMILLAVPVLYFGIYPHFILNLTAVSSSHLVDLVSAKLVH
ncbi:MAG: NADH-quinone oxidoreductase subunit M [Gammaproteobacteria bacterium]|nr:NADH-quinone oxidoreductase subunit M [Gammaproteobacteria bacterium]